MLQHAPMYAYIPARDVARARRFYEDTLGPKPSLEVSGGVVYEFGRGTAAVLYLTPNAGTSQASQAFWDVDDIEREVAELKRRGVEFERYEGLRSVDANGISIGGPRTRSLVPGLRGQHHGAGAEPRYAPTGRSYAGRAMPAQEGDPS